MQDFADMAEAHEWTLRRLREMAGRLTEQAYLRASDAAEADAERESDDDGLPQDATLARRLGRLKAIIAGAGGAEPPPPRLGGAERRALAGLRAERARRAASAGVPAEPWDVLGGEMLAAEDLAPEGSAAETLAADEPGWRGAG